MGAKKSDKFEQNGGKRVGIWIRVSTEEQAKGESPEHHEYRARLFAEAKGWLVADVYHLEGVSGKSVMAHPEARRMLKDVERGHISGLIFSKLARLGRNTKELLEFADYFQNHNADLISLQEAIDTSTPAGRMFYTVIAAMANWEREEIASRVAASIPVRAKLGKSLGGPAPFGYQWKDKKLIPEPNEAPVRRLIHELFVKHKRLKTVARLIFEAGHRTRKGKPFTPNTIDLLLRDPTAKGLHRANYKTYDPKTKGWKLKPESEWVYREVEAIIKPELWDACAEILKEKDSGRKPRAKRPVQLFAGLLYCGCGEKMYVPSNTPKYVCQKCRRKIPISDLEEIFIEQLKDYMLSSTELTAYLEAKDKDIQAKQDLLDSVTREEKNLRAEMEKVYQLYMGDQITAEGFGAKYKPMEARLSQLQEELVKLEASIDFLKVNMLSGDQIMTEARNLANFWPHMSREGKRQVVESVVEKITLGADEIQIDLFYLPTAHLDTNLQTDFDTDSDDEDNEPPTDDNDNNSPDPIDTPAKAPQSLTPISATANAFALNMAKRRTAVPGSDGFRYPGFSRPSFCNSAIGCGLSPR